MTRVLSTAGIALFAVAALAGCGWSGPDIESGPEQPIAFYHSVHAGQNEIPCMYCHYTADESPSAGIPSVKLCVGCHVPGSAITLPENAQLAFPGRDRPAQGDTVWYAEANKLVTYWQQQESIPWVRVHDLPEHVRFSHSPHVNVGLQCQTCHGPVEEMEKVYQFSSLQMGWCIDCHRGDTPLSEEEEASVQARSSYIKELRSIASAGGDVSGALGTWPHQRASIDCTVCHY
jgi:hypothetical protein